jgi:Zn finger protein HypA/HybF involved in hydrogenase expression
VVTGSTQGHEKLFITHPSKGIEVNSLPLTVTCAECNQILYEGNILKSPQDIIKKLDGRCPKCKRKLKADHNAISLSPHIEKNDK